MIIEFFGPPASGKTTLCQALATRLRERGLPVELALSSRPAERAAVALPGQPARFPTADAVRRIAGPMLELLTAGRDMFGKSSEAVMAASLLKLVPPRGALRSLRLRRYIWRRAQSWNGGRHAAGVVIFDQAFIQVIYSLVELGGPADAERLRRALDMVPMPDLLVRLAAPPKALEARLIGRRRGQGTMERLLEVDAGSSLRAFGIIDDLQEMLHQRGQRVIQVNSADRACLDDAVLRLEQAVMARMESVKSVA